MGRKAQPIDVILLKGKKHLTKEEIENRREAEARVKPKADKVRCPQWLSKEGRKEWRRICAELKALDLLTNVDVSSLAVYCDLVSQYVTATKDIQQRGMLLRSSITKENLRDVPNVPSFGEPADAGAVLNITLVNEEPNPSVAQAAKLAQLIKSYLVEFGLSPSARAKLTLPKPVEGQASPFDKKFGNAI